LSDSYINLIFSSRSRERGLLHPDHGLPRRCTTAECGPLVTKIKFPYPAPIYMSMHTFMYMQSIICMHAPAYTHNKCACLIFSYVCIQLFVHGLMHITIYTDAYNKHLHILTHGYSMHAHVCMSCIHVLSGIFHCIRKGVSADADPHYQKLYGRVTDVCSNRKSQPSQGAMKWPRLGRYPSLIRYAPPSGKYAAPNCHRWLDLISFT